MKYATFIIPDYEGVINAEKYRHRTAPGRKSMVYLKIG